MMGCEDHPWLTFQSSRGIVKLMVATAVAAGISGCKPKVNAFVPPPPPEVTVAHPISRPVTRYVESTGTTEAFETVDMRARVAGFLAELNFKPGAAVKKGDLLFVIDRRTYQSAVNKAQAQVLADEAAFKVAETDARLVEAVAAQGASSEIERITKIGKRDAAKAAIDASKAALESARLDLEFCEVRSPIDGRITKNFVDVGNLVGAGGQATLLATVVSARPIYVSIDSSESDLLMIRRERMASSPGAEPGQVAPGEWRPVDIATADSVDFNVHGHVDYVDPALNPQTGTIRVRCRFENENEQLIPGLFVRLRLFQDTQVQMVVPDIALLSDQNGRYALVVNEKDMIEAKHVKIGTLDGTMRVVSDGLSATDRVIVNGLQRARPGLIVKPTLKELDVRGTTAAGGSSSLSPTPATSKGNTPPIGPATPAKNGTPHV